MNRCPAILFTIVSIITGCQTKNTDPDNLTGYKINSPDVIITLPGSLHEISGLTYIDSATFACTQDEKGILFIYDLNKKAIKKQITFFSKSDYEGIARVEDTIYVLRSDGILVEISDYKSTNVISTPYPTYVPMRNNEGLCYDKPNKRLLIAGKENTGKGNALKDKKFIYGFDLKTKSLLPEPVYTFDIGSLKEFAASSGIDLPLKEKKKKKVKSFKPVLLFRPSAICFHPFTTDLYILSSEDHMLFVFDKSGSIKKIVSLNPGLFPQPEGITFLENGDMLISNEGQSKSPATLLRFNYHGEAVK